jgi:organic hydroperoxide reductase OsmC/OhrA
MSEFKVKLEWKRNGEDFSYDHFDRTHQITFDGGVSIQASSAQEYLGKKEYPNPEELLLAASSNCHMLTFLAIAAKSKYTVDHYEDHPTTTLEKNSEGKTVIGKVTLRPRVIFSGDNIPTEEKIKVLHEKSHKYCFIANSICAETAVEPVFAETKEAHMKY